MTALRSGSATDVGRVRSINEDYAFDVSPLYGVADGMGGHAGGDVAARTAVEALQAAFRRRPTIDGLLEAVQDANVAVWEKGRNDTDLHGMGTTLTAAALVEDEAGDGDRLVLVNVGDSRAYRFRNGVLEQLTRDHSVAEELVARGELTADEASIHPHRHILTRALGVAPAVEVDAWELAPRVGDRYLLCSDGLSNEVDASLISGILEDQDDPDGAARELVRCANHHGGSDNITAVVLDVVSSEGLAEIAGAPDIPVTLREDGSSPTGAGAGGSGAAVASAARLGTATVADDGDPVTGVVPVYADELATKKAPAAEGVSTDRHAPRPPYRRRTDSERQRVITFRTVAFVVLVVAVLVAAYLVVRAYFEDSYYLTVDGSQVVIDQGRPGGFLWMSPKTVNKTGVTKGEVPSDQWTGILNSTYSESSLSGARALVRRMVVTECDYEQGLPGDTTTTTLAPGAPAIAHCPPSPMPIVTSPPTTTTTRTTAPGKKSPTSTTEPASKGSTP